MLEIPFGSLEYSIPAVKWFENHNIPFNVKSLDTLTYAIDITIEQLKEFADYMVQYNFHIIIPRII